MKHMAHVQTFCDFADGPRMRREFPTGLLYSTDKRIDLCHFIWNIRRRHLGICEETSMCLMAFSSSSQRSRSCFTIYPGISLSSGEMQTTALLQIS